MKTKPHLTALVFLALTFSAFCQEEPAPRLITKETLITQLKPEAVTAIGSQFDYWPWGYHIQWSPNMKMVVYWAARGNSLFAVANGVVNPPFDMQDDGSPRGAVEPPWIIFSPDSRHYAYVARRGKKQFAVRDGKVGRAYDWIAPNDLHFSADSKRMAYWARRGKKNLMVLHEGTKVKEIAFDPKRREPRNVPDEAPPAVNKAEWRVLERGEKYVVLFNGKEGAPYDAVYDERPYYSADGKHAAWRTQRDERMFIIVDGVEANELGYTSPGLVLPPVVFNNSNSLYTLTLRGKQIFRVEILINPK